MSQTKLIIFDFADTIAVLSPRKEELIQEYIYNDSDIKIPIKQIEQAYYYLNNINFYSSVNIHNAHDKQLYYHEYNQTLLELLGIAHIVAAEGLFEHFNVSKQHWVLKEEVILLLQKLKDDNHILSLLSNFDKKLKPLLSKLKVSHLFDSVYISQEHNLEKPDIDFFKLPLIEHNISASNTYFIGDSYHLDFLPAFKLKIHPILLDEKERYSFINKKNRVSSLTQCQEIIGH